MDDGPKAMVKMGFRSHRGFVGSSLAEETAALKRERWARAVAFDLMA